MVFITFFIKSYFPFTNIYFLIPLIYILWSGLNMNFIFIANF